jgi:hypothetical protein
MQLQYNNAANTESQNYKLDTGCKNRKTRILEMLGENIAHQSMKMKKRKKIFHRPI